MTIKAECGECGRVYNVKDELDGKKIRCKECQAIVLVQSESDDDWDESVDEEEFQPPVRKSTAKTGKRKSRGTGMPVPIIVALVCLAIMIGASLIEMIGFGMAEAGAGNDLARKGGRMFGSIIRIAIQIAVFRGVMKGTASTVTPSIIMAVLTILITSGVAVVVALVPDGMSAAAMLVFFALLRVVYIVCILMPAARDYMRN